MVLGIELGIGGRGGQAGLRDSGENGGGGGGPRPGVSENNEGLNENNPIAIQFRGLFVNIRGNMKIFGSRLFIAIQIKIRGLFEKSRIAIIGRDPNKGVFCKCFGRPMEAGGEVARRPASAPSAARRVPRLT
jgi:hypothetical protein